MSIKAAILEKNGGNDVDKSEYTNLIMDDMPINEISDIDKAFLEGFVECQFLSLNSTGLKVISNLPKLPKLERLELCDNGIETGCDIIATQYPELRVLKLSGNAIAEPSEIKHLQQCLHLESLDLGKNPVAGTEGLRALLPESLDILNGVNKAGEEVQSDDDDEDDSDEERESAASDLQEEDDPGSEAEEETTKMVSGGERASAPVEEKAEETATVA